MFLPVIRSRMLVELSRLVAGSLMGRPATAVMPALFSVSSIPPPAREMEIMTVSSL